VPTRSQHDEDPLLTHRKQPSENADQHPPWSARRWAITRSSNKSAPGGWARSTRAFDERLERDVAIKVLPAGALADLAARKRFRMEALALSKLNHPNIATVREFASEEGIDCLVMEYIAGVSLNERLGQGPLRERDVLPLAEQLAEGLAAAHDQGLAHRDLKPGNLRITPDGRLKILDFGLAQLMPAAPALSSAATETRLDPQIVGGTLAYKAPEQLRGEGVDHRSDIWAAGVVLYEMTTGRRPFDARLPTAIAADIQTKPAVRPTLLAQRLSHPFEFIILKCLEKEPELRYQSARELLADLRRLYSTSSTEVRDPLHRRPPRKHQSRGRFAERGRDSGRRSRSLWRSSSWPRRP
jgi:eukaryotic-like serine/threonine-protein kinase